MSTVQNQGNRARCRTCGNEIAEWANGTCYICLNYERKNGGAPLKPLFKKSPAVTARRQRSKNDRYSPHSHQRLGINRLLGDIYQRAYQISLILRAHHMSEQAIQMLQQQYLVVYFDQLIVELNRWFADILPLRAAAILIRWYALDGKPKASLHKLQQQYQYNALQLIQFQRESLKCLQESKHKSKLEQIIVNTAKTMLRGQ